MIAKPPHSRKLGLIGVALTKQRNNRHDIKALTIVRDVMEKVIIDSGYLDGAPFFWVTIAIRYGLKDDDKPSYQPISRKYGDLPLSIEVDTNGIIGASLDGLVLIFKRAVLNALIHAGETFGRPIDQLQKARATELE